MDVAFFVSVTAMLGVVGGLLWFTGWAEHRVIEPPAESVPAKHS